MLEVPLEYTTVYGAVPPVIVAAIEDEFPAQTDDEPAVAILAAVGP